MPASAASTSAVAVGVVGEHDHRRVRGPAHELLGQPPGRPVPGGSSSRSTSTTSVRVKLVERLARRRRQRDLTRRAICLSSARTGAWRAVVGGHREDAERIGQRERPWLRCLRRAGARPSRASRR